MESHLHEELEFLVLHREAQKYPGTKTLINPAEDNRKKQCERGETKPNSNAIHPRKRRSKPTYTYTPSRSK